MVPDTRSGRDRSPSPRRYAPAPPLPVLRSRAWGQLLVSAASVYLHHAKTFLGLGLLYLPTAIVTAALQALLFKLTRLDALVVSVSERIALTVVATGIWIVTLPITLYLLVRWAFAVQAVAVEGYAGRAALSRSADLVHGHWWRTAIFTAAVTTLGAAAGPLVGVLLLLGTTKSFFLINAISSLVYAVTIPLVTLSLTYLYYDLRQREHEQPDLVPSSSPQPTA